MEGGTVDGALVVAHVDVEAVQVDRGTCSRGDDFRERREAGCRCGCHRQMMRRDEMERMGMMDVWWFLDVLVDVAFVSKLRVVFRQPFCSSFNWSIT